MWMFAYSCCNKLLESSTRISIPVLQAAPMGEGATVDLQVLICARCAKVLTDGDRGTDISNSEITQVRWGSKFRGHCRVYIYMYDHLPPHPAPSQVTQSGAFESASQAGSHAPFPQWDTGSAIGSRIILLVGVVTHRMFYLPQHLVLLHHQLRSSVVACV